MLEIELFDHLCINKVFLFHANNSIWYQSFIYSIKWFKYYNLTFVFVFIKHSNLIWYQFFCTQLIILIIDLKNSIWSINGTPTGNTTQILREMVIKEYSSFPKLQDRNLTVRCSLMSYPGHQFKCDKNELTMSDN